MIFLKKKVLKTALIIFLSAVLFVGVTFVYLNRNVNKTSNLTEQKENKVSYKSVPQNRSIVLIFPKGDALLAHLDFNELCINLVNIENYDSECGLYYGYNADYTVKATNNLLQEMVDRVGGIDIKQNDETMRYTGTQIVDLLSRNKPSDIKGQIISQIFSKISKNNFSRDDIIYLISNCETNISFVDCIYWLDYIKEMCGKVNFVN